MSDNHELLTGAKAAVLILESAPIHDLPHPETITLSKHGPVIFIMREPADVYLWAGALGGSVAVSHSHDHTVTHWDVRGEWFDQPLRVTTNRREHAAVTR